MLHGRDTHLLARATTLNCRGLPDGLPHGLRTTLWCPFLTPTTPTLPLLALEKPSIGPETHQNLPARAHQFGGAHVHPNPCAVSHQWCTWQQVLLTFPPLGTSPRLCRLWASLTTYILGALDQHVSTFPPANHWILRVSRQWAHASDRRAQAPAPASHSKSGSTVG